MANEWDEKARWYAEQASEIIVGRVEADRIRCPGMSDLDLFNEIKRTSPHMSKWAAELARIKLGIV